MKEGLCKGCKLGYDDGIRDISKAKCAVKTCCFGANDLETCADRPTYGAGGVPGSFHGKNGRKYGKYRESLELNRSGYRESLSWAKTWKRAYGKLR